MSASFVSPSVRMDGIASTRSRLSKAGHAPGAIYCSEDIFQREIATCFMKDWLCVGRVEEVAKPGDYMTMRIAGEPVVITRASDNNLHALYNMCAHRGVEDAHGRGNARVFNCPYHIWYAPVRAQHGPFIYRGNSRDREQRRRTWGAMVGTGRRRESPRHHPERTIDMGRRRTRHKGRHR